MNEETAKAFQQIPMLVVYYLASYAKTLPTPEERGGAAQLVNRLVQMRDPQLGPLLAEQAKKAKVLNGR